MSPALAAPAWWEKVNSPMIQYQSSKFHEATLEELTALVASRKEQGHRFVQLCASTKEASCELLYSFEDPARAADEPGIDSIVVDVPDGTPVPSITHWYPAAFVFENEAHDLFGIDVQGINIDFNGDFYTVAVAYPMNPRAASQAQETALEGEEAING